MVRVRLPEHRPRAVHLDELVLDHAPGRQAHGPRPQRASARIARRPQRHAAAAARRVPAPQRRDAADHPDGRAERRRVQLVERDGHRRGRAPRGRRCRWGGDAAA